MKILFLVDHKHRDFIGLALIGYLLEKKYSIVYRPLNNPIVDKIDPDVIIFPNCYPAKETISKIRSWQKKGIKIVIIETEGNMQWRGAQKKITFKPDLYFFWSNFEKEKYKNHLKINEIKNFVVGSPRMDLFHKNYKYLLKPTFNKNNKINVTFAGMTTYQFLDQEKINQIKKRYHEVFINADFDKYFKYMSQVRELTLKYIDYFLTEFENINFYFKPHPNDDIRSWKKLSNTNNNFKLILNDSIQNFLCNSDLHIGVSSCITILEAKVMSIKTLELVPEKIKANEIWYDDACFQGDYIINSKNNFYELLQLFKRYGSFDFIENRDSSSYLKEHFNIFDGNRCKTYAKELDKYFTSMHNQMKNISLKYYSFLFIDYVKSAFRTIKNYIKYKKKYIHDDRGRLDNRINPLDYLYYYRKFKQNDEKM